MKNDKHEHQHKCECEHKRLRFCKKCQKPYCLDCGMEWPERYDGYWYYLYTYSYPTVATLGYADTKWAVIDPMSGYAPTISRTTCDHAS